MTHPPEPDHVSTTSCEHEAAYRFGSGGNGSPSVLSTDCSGARAARWVASARASAHPRRFVLCRRHADLLWQLGYFPQPTIG